RKQLEEWLASKGKKYKRPPMLLLQKQEVKPPCRKVKEEVKQENPEQHCLVKINNTLPKCLKVDEEVGMGKELLEWAPPLLEHPSGDEDHGPSQHREVGSKSSVARGETWVRKIEVLVELWVGQRHVGSSRHLGLCLEHHGAIPPQLHCPFPLLPGEKPEQPIPWEPTTPCPGESQPIASTPGPVGRPLTFLPLSLKLQVTSVPRGRELLEGPELKLLTPVRRSLRVERARSHYPGMLKDHDPVVSSLRELLDAEEETLFFFRKNKALP
ncbi:CKP2L protein, partial [Formicarius rufipectus]|nr:CKP2L protein [Formicarius rufipectus]